MSLGAPELATQEYWDQRYRTDDRDGYDWFKRYTEISQFLNDHLSHNSKILILGCGTSPLGQELHDAGYKHVTSIDFSPVAIDIQRTANTDRPSMQFEVMDIRSLSYKDCTFDIAIDKGTMDAMLCFKGSPWDPPETVVRDCAEQISETARVLRPGGKFLMVSFRPAHFLRPRVQSDQWSCEPAISQIGDFYFSVVAQKMEG